MAAHSTGDTSRKPSGSSTHSGAHSPSSSPNHAQRKLAAGGPGNMFGVGMGNPTGLKPLNGWQVWGSPAPTSKRNASISSAASGNDLSPSQGDASYRANIAENWSTPRSTSGNWDEVGDSPHRGHSQLDPHSLPLHQARQRQTASTLSAPRIDERSPGKVGQYSPQRYDAGLGKDASRYSVAASPTRPTGFATSFSGQQPNGYDSLQTSSMVENELAMGLRGMAVEDDFGAGHPNSQYRQQAHTSAPQTRMPPPMQQHRVPYTSYPSNEYNGYYPSQPAREPYMDYTYAYGATDPSLYGSTATSPASLYPAVSPQTLHPPAAQQPGLFYDYSAQARGGSQYYYPTQAMMYPPSHSPMMTPQLGTANPAAMSDKKRELQQYNIQQHQMGPQNLLYPSIRSTPSPHPQAYAAALDYTSQIPMMLPNGMYAHAGMNPAMHAFVQNMRSGRRVDVNDPSAALRSPILDEFRANKTRKWEMRDILGFVVEFSGDQHGSRFIQQKLETATSEEKQMVFDEIVPENGLQLIQDVFGNYVIQKLFEHGTQVQKTVLANMMEGHILPLSLQMYGCRVVQKAVEYVLPEQQAIFVKELEAHVLKCVKDANGNHVIQKLIERVASDRLGFVGAFKGNIYDLSTHPYGCRVLQRCFEHLPEEQARPLLDELHKYTINLMQDQFGNYVVQFVLEHGKLHDRALVISKLRGQILQMARHKFASNVCEKALLTADAENRRILIDEIMTPKQDGVSPIVTMMKDQFANYVLQRALGVAEGDQKEMLIELVRPQLVNMRRYSSAYSKHLISIEKLLEQSASSKASEPTTPTPQIEVN